MKDYIIQGEIHIRKQFNSEEELNEYLENECSLREPIAWPREEALYISCPLVQLSESTIQMAIEGIQANMHDKPERGEEEAHNDESDKALEELEKFKKLLI